MEVQSYTTRGRARRGTLCWVRRAAHWPGRRRLSL